MSIVLLIPLDYECTLALSRDNQACVSPRQNSLGLDDLTNEPILDRTSKSVDAIRCQIDRRASSCNEIGYDLASGGGADQAKESMSKGEERIRHRR